MVTLRTRKPRCCAQLQVERLEDRRLLSVTPAELAKLLASDADEGDWFGSSVAVSGDTAAEDEKPDE